MRMGTTEMLLILAVVLIVFGPTQLPKLAKMFGKASKSFKEGVEEGLEEDTKKAKKDEE